MSDSEEEPGVQPCPKCQAENALDAAYCIACGAPLAPAATAGGGGVRSRRKGRATGDAAEQARARHEFARVKNSVLAVRAVFAASAIYAVVQVLLWHVVLARLQRSVEFVGSELDQWSTVVSILGWSQVALLAAGFFFVLRSPLIWSVTGACYMTLSVALALWASDFSISVASLIGLFTVVALWFAVGQAARVQRLMAADPKLQIVRKRIDPSRKVVGGVADEARERRRLEKRRTFRSRLRLLGAVAVLLVIGGVAIWQVTKPPSPDATIAAFAKAWQAGDVEALGGLFVDGPASRRAIGLREELERRGWQQSMPALTAGTLDDRGDHAVESYTCTGEPLRVMLARDKFGWHVTGVSLPNYEVPAFASGLAAFTAAWQAKGPEALVDMFRPTSRERLGSALKRMLEKRKWTEQRPALGEVPKGKTGDVRQRLLIPLEDGELEVVFEFWHPSWRLVGIKLPQE